MPGSCRPCRFRLANYHPDGKGLCGVPPLFPGAVVHQFEIGLAQPIPSLWPSSPLSACRRGRPSFSQVRAGCRRREPRSRSRPGRRWGWQAGPSLAFLPPVRYNEPKLESPGRRDHCVSPVRDRLDLRGRVRRAQPRDVHWRPTGVDASNGHAETAARILPNGFRPQAESAFESLSL